MSLEAYSDEDIKQDLKDRGVYPLEIYEDHELLNEVEERGCNEEPDLSSLDTETLICSLNDRNEEYVYENAELENIYYALRDNDLEKVIKLMNPLFDEAIGRQV